MSETKHTPGKWIAAREDEYRTYIEDEHQQPFALVYGAWEDPPEVHARIEANARLIAAAPDLLDALKLTLSVVEKYGPETYAREVRAAIAKAEGRS